MSRTITFRLRRSPGQPSNPAVVFGQPVTADGKTYIPVSEEHGWRARPLGLLEMHEHGSEFHPVPYRRTVVVMGVVAVLVVLALARRPLSRRSPAGARGGA